MLSVILMLIQTVVRAREGPEKQHTFAAAMFPYCAFFPVSLLVLAFSTAATGTCMLLWGTPQCRSPPCEKPLSVMPEELFVTYDSLTGSPCFLARLAHILQI